MAVQSVHELLSQAGWTMVPLYACSLLAGTMAVRKVVQLRRGLIDERVAHVVAETRRALDLTPRRAVHVAEREADAALDELGSGMSLLAFVAQAAPLFGLLGTVLGMVDLFSGMEAAGAAAEMSTLSAGIWKALLTTAAGLIVAIPTLGVHAWFGRRLDRVQLELEERAGRLLDERLGTTP